MKVIKKEVLENGMVAEFVELRKDGNCEVRIRGNGISRTVSFSKKTHKEPLQAMLDWWNK